jgi:hypothetical protein
MKGDKIMSFVSTEMSPADIRACTCGNDGYNNGGMFNGDGAWWIIILLLFGWGGRGFGNGFGGGFGGNSSCGCSPCATQADLAAGFNNSAVLSNLNDLALGQAGIQQTLCQGFNGVNTTVLQGFNGVDNAICNLGYNIQGSINGISREISDCCCTTQRAIDGVRYDMATQACDTRHTIYNSTRDIIDNANANSRAILDFLTQDKISTLTAENQALKFQASQTAQNAFITANQEAQTAELIRRLGADCPTPAYVVQPPQPVTFPTNCCGGVNFASNGCGCGSY